VNKFFDLQTHNKISIYAYLICLNNRALGPHLLQDLSVCEFTNKKRRRLEESQLRKILRRIVYEKCYVF